MLENIEISVDAASSAILRGVHEDNGVGERFSVDVIKRVAPGHIIIGFNRHSFAALCVKSGAGEEVWSIRKKLVFTPEDSSCLEALSGRQVRLESGIYGKDEAAHYFGKDEEGIHIFDLSGSGERLLISEPELHFFNIKLISDKEEVHFSGKMHL